MSTRDKIKYTAAPLPKIMWGVGYKMLEKTQREWESCSDNYREGYLRLFKTEDEAQAYIDSMNKKYNQNSDGTRCYWYKNRGCFPVKVNTHLKKYKSKYRPITSFSMAELYN